MPLDVASSISSLEQRRARAAFISQRIAAADITYGNSKANPRPFLEQEIAVLLNIGRVSVPRLRWPIRLKVQPASVEVDL